MIKNKKSYKYECLIFLVFIYDIIMIIKIIYDIFICDIKFEKNKYLRIYLF